jgi:hypothetical protein
MLPLVHTTQFLGSPLMGCTLRINFSASVLHGGSQLANIFVLLESQTLTLPSDDADKIIFPSSLDAT